MFREGDYAEYGESRIAERIKRLKEFEEVIPEDNDIFNVPRGSGKSTKVMSEFFKDPHRQIIIVPNSTMKGLAVRVAREHFMNSHFLPSFYPELFGVDAIQKFMKQRIFTYDDYIRDMARGITVNKVLIDETFMFTKTQIARLYYRLGQRDMKFIAFGTDMN